MIKCDDAPYRAPNSGGAFAVDLRHRLLAVDPQHVHHGCHRPDAPRRIERFDPQPLFLARLDRFGTTSGGACHVEPQICGLGAQVFSRGSYLDLGISSQRPGRGWIPSPGILVLPGGIYGRLGTWHAGASIGMAVWNPGLGDRTSRRPAAAVDDPCALCSTTAHLGGTMRRMWLRLARSFRPMSGMRTGKHFPFGMILGRCGISSTTPSSSAAALDLPRDPAVGRRGLCL